MRENPIWSDEEFFLIRHESTVPWLILHLHKEYREYSQIPRPLRHRLADLLALIEEEMLAYYRPVKINIASFGNHLPRQHWHIMARFQDDSHFPEPLWAEARRKSTLDLPSFAPFAARLKRRLEEHAFRNDLLSCDQKGAREAKDSEEL